MRLRQKETDFKTSLRQVKVIKLEFEMFSFTFATVLHFKVKKQCLKCLHHLLQPFFILRLK